MDRTQGTEAGWEIMHAALKVIRNEVDPDRMRMTDHVPDEAFIWDVADDALNRATMGRYPLTRPAP